MEPKHIEFRGEDDWGRAVFYSKDYKMHFKSANILLYDHKKQDIMLFLDDLHTTDNFHAEPHGLVKQEIRDAFKAFITPQMI